MNDEEYEYSISAKVEIYTGDSLISENVETVMFAMTENDAENGATWDLIEEYYAKYPDADKVKVYILDATCK